MRRDYVLSNHLIERIKKRNLLDSLVIETVESYDYKVEISETEVHYFKRIESSGDKYLKVVLNPISNKIVTAYFDRKMTKRGCQDENNI
jgi:hypothetical protein